MMRIIYLFFILVGVASFGQSSTIDAKVTYNDGHIEDLKTVVMTNLFDSKFVDPRSFTGKKITLISNDKKVKIPSVDVQKIDYTDLKGNERHFVRVPYFKNLVEVKYDGQVKWYRDYTSNVYDHSLMVQDYIYLGDKSYFFTILKNNKSRLKEFFANRPDLFPLIDKLNYNRFNEEDLYAILQKFDEQKL